MSSYTVKQIAKMLETSEETVRRWIRNGKLESKLPSKKEGNIVTSEALLKFVKETPKYAPFVTAAFISSPATISMALGGLLGGLASLLDGKNKKSISENDVKTAIENKISYYKISIEDKEKEMKKLEALITEEKQELEKYLYALDHLDLKKMVDEINKGI